MKQIIPPTIRYTPVGNDVMASIGMRSKHTLLWERRTGAVYRDTDRRALFHHLTEDKFHDIATSVFTAGHLNDPAYADATVHCGRRRPSRATSTVDGAGWQAQCGCGHWRTGIWHTRWAARRALTAHIKRSRDAAKAAPLDLAAVKRAGVRIPKQRSAS